MRATLIKATILVLLVCTLATAACAAKITVREPIRLSDGDALKAVYLYPHWWEPWKSDDNALNSDLQKIKDVGFNTLCLDHEVSQAVDNDWGWLNREYKLAGANKLSILPWLQLQGADRQSLIKFSHLNSKPAINQDKKPEEDYVSFLDPDFRESMILYINVYLDHYINDPSLLKVKIAGKTHPVVGLMLEAGWHAADGRPLSFDEQSNAYFRDWMRSSHHDLKQLNKQWGTTYKSFDEIDPCDKTIFNYAFKDKSSMPAPVREHAQVRARAINDTLHFIANHVRQRHKDVIFVAEVAYPLASDDPVAAAYRWNAASEYQTVESADLIFIRTLGDTVTGESKKQQDILMDNDKRVVTVYRMMDPATPRKAAAFALDCAIAGNGLAYYNWNERTDSDSSLFDKPEKQGLIKSMNSMYDLLCNPEDRHLFNRPAPMTAQPPAAVQPALAQPTVAPPAPTSTPAAPVEPAKPAAALTPIPALPAQPAPATSSPAAPAVTPSTPPASTAPSITPVSPTPAAPTTTSPAAPTTDTKPAADPQVPPAPITPANMVPVPAK